MTYDLPTKLLHKGIAASISIQLILPFIGMEHPHPTRHHEEWQLMLFEVHEINGLIALSLLSMHLLYSLATSGSASWRTLFPWLTGEGRNQLFAEIGNIGNWFKQGLPDPEQAHTLASTVHGFGLLIGMLMGLTGACIFIGMEENGKVSDGIHEVMELHEGFALLMLLYWLGHVALFIIHQKQGHDLKSKIF